MEGRTGPGLGVSERRNGPAGLPAEPDLRAAFLAAPDRAAYLRGALGPARAPGVG
jgi:hypothetical protein